MSYFADSIDDEIVELLQNGAVGLLPSDTIYGLSARALDQKTVERIHNLKERSQHKPFIVLISEIDQLKQLGINSAQANPVKKYWPGPLSVIFESSSIPAWLHLGTASLAVRMPANLKLRNLMRKVGPIVSTSANLQGHAPARTLDEACKYFDGQLDFYVDDGELSGQPSTLVKIQNGELVVLRQGALKLDANIKIPSLQKFKNISC